MVPRTQFDASEGSGRPAQIISCAAGSGGPITDAAVMQASRCRPASPSQRASRSSDASTPMSGRLSTNARYQHGLTNGSGCAPHSSRGSVTGRSGLVAPSAPITANQ